MEVTKFRYEQRRSSESLRRKSSSQVSSLVRICNGNKFFAMRMADNSRPWCRGKFHENLSRGFSDIKSKRESFVNCAVKFHILPSYIERISLLFQFVDFAWKLRVTFGATKFKLSITSARIYKYHWKSARYKNQVNASSILCFSWIYRDAI